MEDVGKGLDDYLSDLLARYKSGPNNLARTILSHSKDGRGGLIYVDETSSREYSLDELGDSSARLAAYLFEHGIERGDRVGVLLPKCPELLITALAIWRLGAVYVPLFTAFGTDAISFRVEDSKSAFVVTNSANVAKLDDLSRSIAKVIVVGETQVDGDVSFAQALSEEPYLDFVDIDPMELIVLIYTSGTTGTPKGVPVPIWALAAFEAYMTLGIGIRSSDTYWNLADPGWAYGLYYGVIGPLSLGHSILFLNLPFDPKNIEGIWQRYNVTNFAGAPTAYRAMRAALSDKVIPTKLERMSSAGEPLNPEVIDWAAKSLGVEIRDHYGQTELGMMINNHFDERLRRSVKPGSMGQNTMGFRAVVLSSDFVELGFGIDGEVAIDTYASPLFWFPGYYNALEKTKERFSSDGRYYLSGDVASMDDEGNFFFAGRSDDVILTAGYRVGPFEVESTIMAHRAVAECAVIGVPDELRGEAISAYVVLREGEVPSDQLAEEIRQVVRDRLSKTSYPRFVNFVEALPKTPSGKIQRFLLRRDSKD